MAVEATGRDTLRHGVALVRHTCSIGFLVTIGRQIENLAAMVTVIIIVVTALIRTILYSNKIKDFFNR